MPRYDVNSICRGNSECITAWNNGETAFRAWWEKFRQTVQTDTATLSRNVPRATGAGPRFPANDPIFTTPEAAAAGGSGGILAAMARIGGWVLLGADIAAKIADELSQQRQDDLYRGIENQIAIKLQRRAREKDVREIFVRSGLEGLPAGQSTVGSGPIQPVQVPDRPTVQRGVPERAPSSIEYPPGTAPQPDAITTPGPVQPQLPAQQPVGAPAGGVAPGSVARPSPTPVNVPTAWPGAPWLNPIGPNPFGVPYALPQPVVWAVPGFGVPRPSPKPLTGLEPRKLSFADDPRNVVQPFPQPQPQPQNQRCRPCKEDNPEPRTKCYKGLYREGPLDTEVDYTQWAEIDCATGREL